jgi:hypothetical protein
VLCCSGCQHIHYHEHHNYHHHHHYGAAAEAQLAAAVRSLSEEVVAAIRAFRDGWTSIVNLGVILLFVIIIILISAWFSPSPTIK